MRCSSLKRGLHPIATTRQQVLRVLHQVHCLSWMMRVFARNTRIRGYNSSLRVMVLGNNHIYHSSITTDTIPMESSSLNERSAGDLTDESAQSRKRLRPERKHWYVERKQEKTQLAADARMLELQLARLKDKKLLGQRQQNAAMKEILQIQQHALWNAYSLLSNRLTAPHLSPLTSFIHLTCDPLQRRDALMRLCGKKTAEGRHFALERSQGLDPLDPFRTEDLYLNPDGDFCCDQYDITQFYGVRSLQQVYEALLFYMFNMEISITEKLGHITLRENCDSLENHISHQRLVSCDDNGVMYDINNVTFVQFADRGSDDSYGVIATDFVDVDELYPYRPEMNVRKDVVATGLLTAHRRKKAKRKTGESPSDGNQEGYQDGGELVVVMRRAIFVKLRRSDLDLSDSVVQKIREGIGRWNDITIKTMRDYLVSTNCNTNP